MMLSFPDQRFHIVGTVLSPAKPGWGAWPRAFPTSCHLFHLMYQRFYQRQQSVEVEVDTPNLRFGLLS